MSKCSLSEEDSRAGDTLLAGDGDDRQVGTSLTDVADRVQGRRVQLVIISEQSSIDCEPSTKLVSIAYRDGIFFLFGRHLFRALDSTHHPRASCECHQDAAGVLTLWRTTLVSHEE